MALRKQVGVSIQDIRQFCSCAVKEFGLVITECFFSQIVTYFVEFLRLLPIFQNFVYGPKHHSEQHDDTDDDAISYHLKSSMSSSSENHENE